MTKKNVTIYYKSGDTFDQKLDKLKTAFKFKTGSKLLRHLVDIYSSKF